MTLLVPEGYWKLFEKHRQKLRGTENLLKVLLERHQKGSDWELRNQCKLATRYQSKGLCLQKHCFWVDSFLWHRFKLLARSYNVSICCLFVALLKFLVTKKNNTFASIVKFYEKLKIPSKTARKTYLAVPPDTS